MASPAEMASPSCLSHDTTRPSFMVDDSAGMVMVDPSAFSAVVVVRSLQVDGLVEKRGGIPKLHRLSTTEKAADSGDSTTRATTTVHAASVNLMMVSNELGCYYLVCQILIETKN